MTSQLSKDGARLTVHVPMTFRKRAGRRLMLAPSGTEITPARVHIDSALVKAATRAHRWKKMLESGAYASVTELARAEKINQSYLCRILRLSLLAPDIVDSVLNGTHSPEFTLERAMKSVPVSWVDQRRVLRVDASEPTKCAAIEMPSQLRPLSLRFRS